MSVRAGIVATGTELLSGQVTDRNGPWLSERLSDLGVEVAHRLTVGDRPQDLEAALRFLASEGMDLIVTTGGLGPTADDLTAEIVARFAGRELVLDAGMEERIAAILRSLGRRLRFDPEALRAANRKQAMVPKGAATIDPAGTAPGLVVPAGETVVIVMPGPPRELHSMWPRALETSPARAVLDRAPEIRTAQWRMFGIPESELAAALREIEAEQDVSGLEVTTCLRGTELVVDVRYLSEHEGSHEALRESLRERFERYWVSGSGETTDEVVAGLLRGRRLAVAESCTGGLLAARLTRLPGSSEHVAGGVVAYSDEAKVELLGVDAALIGRHGAVSPEVAEAMAAGAMERFGADVSVAVTGIAGPGGGTSEKPVGYVCMCAKDAEGRAISRAPVLPGNREDVRDRSVVIALHLLRYLLTGEDAPL